jgi:WD40 repeat protein
MFHVFGDQPFRTDGDLLALAFDPDGGLWSVEDPGLLRHWNAAQGQVLDWHLLSELEMTWAFSGDARLLASGSDDLSFWDVPRGRLLSMGELPSWVTALGFSRDGSLLATGHDDGAVRLWDVRGQRLIRELDRHDRPVSAVVFSSDGERLASAGEDRAIRIWGTAKGELLGSLIGHTDRIPALAWHPQGRLLYSAGWDTTARVWDTTTFEPVILLNSHDSQVTTLAISPDGRLLACADSTPAVHVWDTTRNRTLSVLRGHAGEVRCLAFSPNGERLVSGGTDRVIHLWTGYDRMEASAGQAAPAPVASRVYRSAAPDVPARDRRDGMSLSPDGARLACIDGGARLRIWETASVHPSFHDPESGPLFALAWGPDGRWVAGGGDRIVHLWDAANYQRRSLTDGQPAPTTALAFRPGGRLLASASAEAFDVWLWDPDTSEPTLIIPDAVDGCGVEALAFHPQGRLLAVGGIDWLATSGSDGGIGIWDVAEPRPVAFWRGGVRALAFHPSGRLLAAASLGRTIHVWDVRNERVLFTLEGHDEMVYDVAYSPDGNWLATSSADRTVRLWDAETGRPLARAELDTQVQTLCFSPDNRFLFTGNVNTSCYQLDVQRIFDSGRPSL